MWLELQIFGFTALWSPYFLLFVFGIGLLYFLITGPFRHHFTESIKPLLKEKVLFYLGLILLYVIKGSPIDLLSHIMFTAHMIQMALLYFVFPILIIKGIPNWLWKKIVYAPFIHPIFNFFTRPLVALLIFSSFLALYHMPAIFDFSKSNIFIHSFITVVILIAALFMWWVVMPPLEEYEVLKPGLKIFYLAASAAIVTVACALIIFASTPLFSAYSSEGAWIQAMSLCVPVDVLDGLAPSISGPELFSPLSTLHDQQLGGVLMKMMQEVVYLFVAGRIFFSTWFTRDSMKVDPLPTEQIPRTE